MKCIFRSIAVGLSNTCGVKIVATPTRRTKAYITSKSENICHCNFNASTQTVNERKYFSRL